MDFSNQNQLCVERTEVGEYSSRAFINLDYFLFFDRVVLVVFIKCFYGVGDSIICVTRSFFFAFLRWVIFKGVVYYL